LEFSTEEPLSAADQARSMKRVLQHSRPVADHAGKTGRSGRARAMIAALLRMHIPPPDVVDNKESHQYEIRVGDDLARLRYRLHDGEIELIHTEVPKALEGQGLASALAKTALEHAAAQRLRVIPTCPFVRSYIARNAAYARLTQRSDN
jgi:uncharacterized protein